VTYPRVSLGQKRRTNRQYRSLRHSSIKGATVAWQAFALAGQPPQESIAEGLNYFCEQLDHELSAAIPDKEQRVLAVAQASGAVCRRLNEWQVGHA
jgi:uncharacterized membrane protein affecting hemolysin expression